jgi:hypothetical protein
VNVAVDPDALTDEQQRLLRRYGVWVTLGMMVLCNVIFLGGLWLTGVKLEQLIRIPDVFNPRQDVCLRFTWHRVEGDPEPVRPARRMPFRKTQRWSKAGMENCILIMGRESIIASLCSVCLSSRSFCSAFG